MLQLETSPSSIADGQDRARPLYAGMRMRFAGLEDAEALVLAVSGGPDSMALMLLASQWAASLGSDNPRLHIATIDHGLRPGSAAEAAMVVDAAATLGLPCAVLVWSGAKPATRIQERARAARYRLLAEYAGAVGATAILTAHHADDQAETVLLRLTRGSGLGGLAGMRRDQAIAPGLRLVRPLLDVPKRDLVALCRSEGQRFVDDPSNQNPAYARARLRAQSDALDRLGLDRVALVRLARRMAQAEDALEAEADRVERHLEPRRGTGTYRVVLGPARDAASEILLRLLRRAVRHVIGSERAIRLDRLEALGEAVRSALREGRPHRTTLAGTRITLGRDTMLAVVPEPIRRRGNPSRQGKPDEVPS